MALILRESCSATANAYDYSSGASGTFRWQSQSFTPSIGHQLISLDLYLYRVGSPGTVTVEVYLSTVADAPTGSALASTTFSGNALPTIGGVTWLTGITFASPATLTAGVKYVIVLKALASDGTTSNCVYWGYSTATSYAGGKRAFTTNGTTWSAQNTHDFLFKEYGSTTAGASSLLNYTKSLVAVGGNSLWYESAAGTMSVLTDSQDDIETVGEICTIAEAYQKVFIANGSKLRVADFSNAKITTADIYVAGSKYLPDNGTVLTGGISGAIMVCDFITASDSACSIYGKKTTTAAFSSGETVTGTNSAGQSVSFVTNAAESAGPFWYNWTVYAASSTWGVLPGKATLVCNYRGRLVLAGNSQYPHQWYMSRQANPWDFVFTANDAQSAVSGADADAGKIGDVVTSLIPLKDDYLIFGCTNSIWLLSGDPMDGGTLDVLSKVTGVFGPQSWCLDNQGILYFWGIGGVYKMNIPGQPENISKVTLPNLTTGEAVNPSTHRITMAYDNIRHGILICITTIATGANSNYWFDLVTNGFFPESYPVTCSVYSAFNYDSTDITYRKMILGCSDGYLRHFDGTKKNDDDGSADALINSYVAYGPIKLAPDSRKTGTIKSLFIRPIGGSVSGGSLTDSDGISYRLYAAQDPDTVYELMVDSNSPVFTGLVSKNATKGGLQLKSCSNGYAYLKLYNSTLSETWGIDEVIINLKGRKK